MAPKRPYDDLETDYLEEENESGFLSLVSVIIAFIAVAVFIALAWYAYQSNTGSDSGEEIEVVYPEEGPVREAPEETGGWQFPHQDKSVYNITSAQETEESESAETKVEQILPAPEQPVKRPDVDTKTWMNDKLKQEPIAKTDAEKQKEAKKKEAFAPKQEKSVEPAKEAPQKTTKTVSESEEVKPDPVKEEKEGKTETVEKEDAKPAVEEKKPAPQPVPVASPKQHSTETPEPVAATAPVKPAPAPAVAKASGSYKIQLGAVRSDADARSQWQRIQNRHSLLADKSLQVQAAEVPGKGMFYRIQATGFANSADAKAACAKLTSAGQACFAVGN